MRITLTTLGRRLAAVPAACLLAACAPDGGPTTPGAPAYVLGGGLLPADTALYARAPLPAAVQAGGSMEAKAADFDGDGDLDLLVARENLPNVLLLNDGAGGFADASMQLPRDVQDSEDIAVGDFDGDGDPDAVVANEDAVLVFRFLEYYLNDGTGHFADAGARLPQDGGPSGENGAIIAGDIDADGDLDLVVGAPGRERALVNDGQGTFSDESAARLPNIPVGAVKEATTDLALGDVDGDGDPDLVAVSETGGPSYVALNDGAGVFTLAPAANLPAVAGEGTRNVDLADVDGDGDLDMLLSNANASGGTVPSRLLPNDGQGAFTDVTAQRLPGAGLWMATAFVDIDADGDLDFVTNNFSMSPFKVFLNDGQGTFTDRSGRYLPAGTQAQGVEVEVADFNGDGKPDIYFANHTANADFLLLAK